LIKICETFILKPSRRTSKPQEKSTALRREHPALAIMNFLHFFFSVGLVAILDPDSQSESASKSIRIRIFNSRKKHFFLDPRDILKARAKPQAR
jgi:hypothetical protein